MTRLGVLAPPINLDAVVKMLEIELRYERFPEDVSGALFRSDDRVTIAVNQDHHSNRQRFTIAHEIGHFLLHPGSPAYYDSKHQVGVHLRAAVRGASSDPREIEANRFAAELLMPRRMLLKAMAGERQVDSGALAHLFEVSEEAMTYRLAEIRPS